VNYLPRWYGPLNTSLADDERRKGHNGERLQFSLDEASGSPVSSKKDASVDDRRFGDFRQSAGLQPRQKKRATARQARWKKICLVTDIPGIGLPPGDP
jgi:hypothetical protein